MTITREIRQAIIRHGPRDLLAIIDPLFKELAEKLDKPRPPKRERTRLLVPRFHFSARDE